jgi:uracil-DNA glycosylase family 4
MLLNGLPDSCSGCPLSTNLHPGYFTKVVGQGRSGVLIIGEASGENEAKEARPFVHSAPAGSILKKAISIGGTSEDDYWITNIIRCRPPNNILTGAPYEQEAISHCSGYLNRVIREYNPRAILALGAIPLRELTGRSGGKESVSYLRGYCLQGPNGIPTIPSYHPAFTVRRNTGLIPLLVKDLSSARSAAAGRLTYVVDPSAEMQAFEGVKAFEDLYEQAKADPECWIVYDIETKESLEGIEDELVEFADTDDGGSPKSLLDDAEDLAGGGDVDRVERESSDQSGNGSDNKLVHLSGDVTSIQFAISDSWGVYGDWSDERIRTLAQNILSLPNPKVAHNGNHFDRPRLEREGIIIRGDHYDSLSMRRALQPDLPAGLQQVSVDYGWRWPWKHYSGSNAILYGVADVCSLVRIVSKLPNELDRLGMWDGYQRFIRETRDLVEIPWEKRGIPMSVSRLDETREWLTREVVVKTVEVKSHIPDELHSSHPKEGYKDIPDRIKDLVMADPDVEILFNPTTKILKNGKVKLVKSKTKISDIYKMLLNMELPGLLNKVLDEHPELALGDFGGSLRLFEKVWFNPRSSQQMIKYLKFKGYEVPKSFKDGKETTADKLMKRLQEETKDPVIALSREIRALEKMRDSYTGKIGEDGVARGGWIPDSDGRLRTRAMTNSTWQFSSVSPNVFTLPKRRKELADRFRKCVAAEPGHIMIELDFKAFHDLTTAALATDERKWRTAKLDPHAYVTGFLIRYPGIERALELSDEDLKLYLKEIRSKHEKVRDEQAKPLNHGTNFGQGYRRLYFENEEFFESELQAKQMLLMLKRVYPKTFAWQEQLLESLDVGGGRTPYLQSVWGARRWFWDVWSWKKSKQGQWYKTKGQDAEKALAFLPSNHAHGMFRKKLLEAAERDWLDRYELVLFPHDAWVLHPPIELADECIENIKTLMESPVIELANPILCPEGLSCSVDVKIGPSMSEMKEIH